MALEEHLGRTDASAAIERRRAPIEGHMCRCAMAAMLDAVVDVVRYHVIDFSTSRGLGTTGVPPRVEVGAHVPSAHSGTPRTHALLSRNASKYQNKPYRANNQMS
jgi:hypothetical protein